MGLDTGGGVVVAIGMARTSKTPNVRTLEAKALFLTGEHGVRVTCPKEIARRTGMHERTVREYMRDWQDERHEMLKSVHDGSLVWELSEETLNAAMSDESFIRKRMNDLKVELEETEDIAEKLWDLLDRVDDLMNLKVKDFARLERLIETYLQNNATKKAITTQFLALKKVWDSVSGIDSRMKAGETALKSIAQVHARHEAQEAIEKAKAKPRPVNGEVIEDGLEVFEQ